MDLITEKRYINCFSVTAFKNIYLVIDLLTKALNMHSNMEDAHVSYDIKIINQYFRTSL